MNGPGIENSDSSLAQAAWVCDGHLFEAVDLFPMPIALFAPQGDAAYINSAFRECFGILPGQVVGKLNILRDPFLCGELGLSEYLRSVFAGEVRSVGEVRAPCEEILRRYGAKGSPSGITSLYQNITCFPIRNGAGQIEYVAAMFLTTRAYGGQPDIAKAREFIENTWLEEFDMGRVAEAARLSRYHFARLFKKHVGITPYSYYQNIKVQKLKEALCDANLTIAQAFSACGLEYSGNFAKVFKNKTGMTPSQYRRASRRPPER